MKFAKQDGVAKGGDILALPEEFLQELRLRNNISDVISGYVNLRRRGRNMVGLCPFHGEKTPSFTVYPETDSFYCFGCGVGGDVIGFIRRAENLDYIEAVKLLAQRAGMDMPEDSYDDSMQKLRMRIYEANREAARFFHAQLYSPTGKSGLDYIRGRQLSERTIRSFGLGFAPNSWSALSDYLMKKGFKPTELVQANLAFKNKNGGISDRFRNRVMFPIIDVRGNVIAFGGRIMTDEKPKYLNTSDTVVFKKSNNLFALNKAKNAKSDKLILCEGYMDVIALHQAGFNYAIATLGTALTPEQAVIIKRYTSTVVICYDADEAGQKATARAIDILRKEGLNIKVLTIPDGKDPDEYIKRHGQNGPIKFKNLLEGTGNDLEYRILKLKQSHNLTVPEGKVEFMTEAAKLLSALDNEIERDVYASKLCLEMGVEKAAFDRQVQRYRRNREKTDKKAEFTKIQRELTGFNDKVNSQKNGNMRAARAEEALLAYLIHNPDMVRSVYAELPPEKMVTEFNRKVYSAITQRILSGASAMLIDISSEFSPEENSRIAAILAKHNVETATPQACREYVSIILEEGEKRSAKEIASESDEDIQAYFNMLKEQQKKKKQ